MSRKQREEIYSLTFKGLLMTVLPDEQVERVLGAVELQCYRQKANAVVFADENKGGTFLNVGRG